MDKQSPFDSESKNHDEYDPLVTADSFFFESPNLEEAMASCPESLGDQAMALCHDPESHDDKSKASPTEAGNTQQFKQPSPTIKKKRASTNTDDNGCKGCKCKKSERLKLYCECFAAGIFCTDPCSCQGCLNIPEYEDTVLETKKQIESRDQLAFLPKLVRQSTVLASNNNNNNMEDANLMTASRARHKRGCNCKKSMCQKKYCECYRANVGCFNGCGCEDCKNDYGTKDYVARALLDQSSPSSDSSSNTEECTNIPQSQGSHPWPSSIATPQCVQPLNVTSNQVEPAPRPDNIPLHQGLILQPQFHITLPRRQEFPSQSQSNIAPQPIGQNDMFPGSQRQMLGRRQQVFPQQLQQQQQQNLRQPNQLQQPSMMQTTFLPSLILEQPNNNVQHSTDQFVLQQHSLAMSHQRQQQQSSIVQQQQTPMTLITQQPLLHEQLQHQLMGPRSNATNIQVQAHLLGPPHNVGDTDRLLLQQNDITDIFSQFPPPFF